MHALAWESVSPYAHAPSRPPVGRLALRPPFIPAGVSSRAAEQSIPPVVQCAHLPFRRQQASSHPLTCHGMVPQASRTQLSGITKPRDFRRGVSCWRYLSSQAVSSQVLSAEASLTDLSRDGAAGIPNSLFRHNKTPRLSSRGFVLALPIFPGRLQPSIVSRSELNFRVRDGNGWTLALISTNYSLEGLHLQNRTTKEGIRKA